MEGLLVSNTQSCVKTENFNDLNQDVYGKKVLHPKKTGSIEFSITLNNNTFLFSTSDLLLTFHRPKTNCLLSISYYSLFSINGNPQTVNISYKNWYRKMRECIRLIWLSKRKSQFKLCYYGRHCQHQNCGSNSGVPLTPHIDKPRF